MSRLRRLLAGLTVALVATTAVAGGLVGTATAARALTPVQMLATFDPADIISDQVMFNPGTMTAASIQSFLDAQVPTCHGAQHSTGLPCLKDYRQTTVMRGADPMCSTYAGATNESAATIVFKVARACGVNPQVLLVMLQKEEGLVQDDWPTANQYRTAMGYGCPDTAACDSDYFGFFNQVYKAAWALKRYTSPPGTSGPGWTVYDWFPVGKPSSVLYNPDFSCGARTITIKNKATASLYYYTPYQPNPAALSAGYGVGDSCSAYGNRNFFLYFTTWFGSTHYAVTGAIKTFWASTGGSTGTLGNPTANAVSSTANGGGSSQTFQRGTVYSSKAGTWMMSGAVGAEYVRRGGVTGSLGWPAGPQRSIAANGGGVTQAFTSGDIYASAEGAYAVREDLRAAYGRAGGVTALGWPTMTAATLGTGWVQRFTGGSVYWSTATGGFGVPGATDAHYLALKGPQGVLGWPRSPATARTADGITGTRQTFQQGDVYSSKAGTAAVLNPKPVLGSAGVPAPSTTATPAPTPTSTPSTPALTATAAAATLGWPTADPQAVTANGGGTVQTFTGGRLYIQAGGAPVAVTGGVLSAYLVAGETASLLGWPSAAAQTITAQGTTGVQQAFAGGLVQTVNGSSATVTGSILQAYRLHGGVTGFLGWASGPVTSSSAYGGGWSQPFTGGAVFASTTSKQAHPLSSAPLAAFTNAGGIAALGWPGAQRSVPDGGGGAVVELSNGRIYSSRAGTVAFTSTALADYLARGGPSGPLGWPVSALQQVSANGATGTQQVFAGGVVQTLRGTTRTVTGPIWLDYRLHGAAAGSLGWVTGAAASSTAFGGGSWQTFGGGTVYASAALNQVHPLSGSLLAGFVRSGGVAKAGWPVGAQVRVTDGGGGWLVTCSNGRIYSSRSGSFLVSGPALSKYLALGAAASRLGWPTGAAARSTAGTTQAFQHGTVTVTTAGAVKVAYR